MRKTSGFKTAGGFVLSVCQKMAPRKNLYAAGLSAVSLQFIPVRRLVTKTSAGGIERLQNRRVYILQSVLHAIKKPRYTRLLLFGLFCGLPQAVSNCIHNSVGCKCCTGNGVNITCVAFNDGRRDFFQG